jgi:hypothetical protein
MPVFTRATRKDGYVIFDRQMTICWRAVNTATFVAFLMFGDSSREISAANQNLRQQRLGPNMHDYKDGSIEILRQMLVEFAKDLHSAGRSADDNDICVLGRKPPLNY